MTLESTVFDRKKFIIGICISLFALSLGYKLPYTDHSIAQMLIPAIRFKSSALYLSGLLVLVILAYAAHLMVESGKYKNKVIVTLILLFLGLPLMTNVFDVMTSPVYRMSSGVKTLKIEESKFNILQENDELKLDFTAVLRSYKEYDGLVKVYIRVPEVIDGMLTESEILVYETNRLYPRKEWEIDTSTNIKLENEFTIEDLHDTWFYDNEYTLILVDDEQRSEIVIYGSL